MTAESHRLCADLNYTFKDDQLLRSALTHRSAGGRHNERLEFLGDGVLNFVIAAALFDRFPEATEGHLSRLRANLVRKETLAELARELDLGHYLVLGSGELKSGGHRRESILADALEAVMGAVYLDAGFDRCARLILNLYTSKLDQVSPSHVLKDPKTRLQEYLQSRRLELPVYEVINVAGEAHSQVFRVSCDIAQAGIRTEGQGSSRRRAEQEAAAKALEQLDNP